MELLFLPSVLAALSALLMVVGMAQVRQGAMMRERMSLYLAGDSFDSVNLREIERSRPFSERVLLPMVRAVAQVFAWFWPENRLKAIQQRLLLAGSPGGMSATDFLGLRGLAMITLVGVALLYGVLTSYPVSFFSLLLLGVLGFCGLYLPDVWLSRRITRRQQQILKALPDALDMLTITIEAGLSFESGLQEIMQKWDNELSREFTRVLRDIGMGQSRRRALLGLSERTAVPDVTSFVASLNQADELGVSIGRVLKTQSEDMRVRRRQRAYEKANQAPVKIMFPLVFLIFPAIFAVLLGPAVPQLLALGG
jgi:tight adherence protein C